MSGPKAVAISAPVFGPVLLLALVGGAVVYGATALASAAATAARVARHRRALERLQQQIEALAGVRSRLRALGLPADEVESALAKSSALAARLANQTATEASAIALEQQAEALANHQSKSTKALEMRVVELQRRFQSFAQDSTRLRDQVTQFESCVRAMVPAEWPNQKRDAVLKRLRAIQEDGQALLRIEAELSKAGIARLEKAEQAIVSVGRKFDQFQRDFEVGLQGEQEAKAKAGEAAKVKAGEAAKAKISQAAAEARNRDAAHQERLHRELGNGEPAVLISEFLAKLAKKHALLPKECKVLKKLDDLLVKIGALQDTAGWTELMQQSVAMREERDPRFRVQFFESLCLEAGRRLRELRAVPVWQAKVDKLLEEAVEYAGTAVDAVVAELREVRRAGRVVALEPWEKRLAETKQRELARLQREHKRRVILESLKSLGYEVDEGMETALVKAGKLVIRKPGEADYAIELLSNDDLSLLQTAMVRYSDSDTLTEQQRLRDQERETEWCGDHKQLRDRLAERGYQTNFKMQLPSGAHPVRIEKRAAAHAARTGSRSKAQKH